MSFQTVNRRLFELKQRMGTFWNLVMGSFLLLLIFLFGIVGFMFLEGWDFVSSFYMVVITLSTVGYGEVHPLSQMGRMFAALLIMSGVGGFMYIVASFSQILLEGRLQVLWGKRRMQKAIGRLEDHFIVCGYGRIGSVVVQEIRNEGFVPVVLEQNTELIQKLELEGVLCVEGDATDDELLLSVGLRKAKALISALSSEAANVYVTLTARQLCPELTIIARASQKAHISRLKLAGADRVVMPHLIGGVRMAQNVLRPTVTNFLELAMQDEIDLQMEELLVPLQSSLGGKNLIESEIRPRYSLIIIAIKKSNGEMRFNPGPQEVIQGGDTLLMVGQRSNLQQMRHDLYGAENCS
ncbi:voltage-gated potassium channel [Paucidesulfovibrio gracilis DSM 16080]|uniref:Voltage-gated potassium channel n=1 Tax=Paucidesulfovibrio gracilis DSM 16080 TaxID=1121449 RepID=A0A1T4WSG4_9BACT|nr:potassium channel protein [Paucidesulfovibrio gracilis]SKA80313.1 voltage-gated potassium channel [Paucidesulfovibrio gracilis DSM 16080]